MRTVLRWTVEDIGGAPVFRDDFDSYADAEDFLADYLGADYVEERGRYFITDYVTRAPALAS